MIGNRADNAQGVAASQRELQAYPNDWAIAADYGAGAGSDDGGMYVNHWYASTGMRTPALHSLTIAVDSRVVQGADDACAPSNISS